MSCIEHFHYSPECPGCANNEQRQNADRKLSTLRMELECVKKQLTVAHALLVRALPELENARRWLQELETAETDRIDELARDIGKTLQQL